MEVPYILGREAAIAHATGMGGISLCGGPIILVEELRFSFHFGEKSSLYLQTEAFVWPL